MTSNASSLSLQYVKQVLVNQLPRPVTLTAQNIHSLVTPCLTEKLDGVRHLLVISPEGTYALNMLGEILHVSTYATRSTTTIYDAEKVDDIYYWFDVLFSDDVDIRHLPLYTRLKAGKVHILDCMKEKAYSIGKSPKAIRNIISSFQVQNRKTEGYILLNMTDHYSVPPLKFKYNITCDFLVAYAHGTEEEVILDLYVQKYESVCILPSTRQRPNNIRIKVDERNSLGISEKPVLKDNVILECKLEEGCWKLIRRRLDRSRPNSLRTVLNNLDQEICTDERLFAELKQTVEKITFDSKISYVQAAIKKAAVHCISDDKNYNVKVLFLPPREELLRELQNLERDQETVLVTILSSYKSEDEDRAAEIVSIQSTEQMHRKVKTQRVHEIEGSHFILTLKLPEDLQRIISNIAVFTIEAV